MDFKNILLSVEGNIGIIQLNRPKALNALNRDVLREIGQAVDLIAENDEVRAVILTGNERAFAAGADITEMVKFNTLQAMDSCVLFHGVYDKLELLPKPVIAAVAGMAFGGGCELALACDLRIAAAGTKFGQPEIKLGIIPGAGGTQRLPRLIGATRAKDLVFRGNPIDAEEALAWGLVNRVVPAESLMEEARKMAAELASRPKDALAAAKRAVNRGLDVDLNTGNAFERECFAALFATEDQKEGMQAFMDKRKANFK